MKQKSLRIPEGQESLPFRKQSGQGLLMYATNHERLALYVIGIGLIVFAVLYSYFVMASIIHVASRGDLSRQAGQLSAAVSHLETAYLAGSDTVTESYAQKLGYVAPSNKVFVEKKPVVTIKDAR